LRLELDDPPDHLGDNAPNGWHSHFGNRTGPQLPKYISHAFGSLDKPRKPGYLRSAYGAICCHKFKPKNQTGDIFLAQILGHKLLGPNASLSVGQSYKDFYVV
jgi:Telomere resolvase